MLQTMIESHLKTFYLRVGKRSNAKVYFILPNQICQSLTLTVTVVDCYLALLLGNLSVSESPPLQAPNSPYSTGV